jgi:hypothetical protein
MKLFYNPEYLRWKAEWQEAFDLYEGRHEVLTQPKYLYLHAVEDVANKNTLAQQQSMQLRAGRCERTRYLNISEIIVSIWTAIFFRECPEVPPEVDKLFGGDGTGECKNVDGYGKTLFSLIKQDIFNNIALFGRCFILSDAPRGAPVTKTQELELGIFPRLRALHPMAVTDWDIETADQKRLGQFNMLRHEYMYLGKRTRATQRPDEYLMTDELVVEPNYGVYQYKQDTQPAKVPTDPIVPGQSTLGVSTNYEQECNWEQVNNITTRLNKIPVAYYIDRPWLREANQEILRHFNIRSNRDNILYQQGFDKVYTKGVDYNDPSAVRSLSEYTTVGLPENGDAFKLAPVELGAYERAEAEAFTNALKAGFNMLRTLPADSREGLSAESLAAEKENLIALVESTLDDIETVTNEAIRNAALFKGITDFSEEVELSSVGVEQTVEHFTALAGAFMDKLNKYPKASKDLVLKAAEKLHLSEEAMEEIRTLEVKFESQMSATDVLDQAIGKKIAPKAESGQ